MIDFLQIGVPALNKLMIQMEGIVKRFGSITALDNMNFHAYGGEITAIVGDNGSGKSTLIQILTGCLKPDQVSSRLKTVYFILLPQRRQWSRELQPSIRIWPLTTARIAPAIFFRT